MFAALTEPRVLSSPADVCGETASRWLRRKGRCGTEITCMLAREGWWGWSNARLELLRATGEVRRRALLSSFASLSILRFSVAHCEDAYGRGGVRRQEDTGDAVGARGGRSKRRKEKEEDVTGKRWRIILGGKKGEGVRAVTSSHTHACGWCRKRPAARARLAKAKGNKASEARREW